MSSKPKKSPKKQSKRPISGSSRHTPAIPAKDNKALLTVSHANTALVRALYDTKKDLGNFVLFIFLGPQPTGPRFEITSLHASLLPAQTLAVFEQCSQQPYRNFAQRLYFFDAMPEIFELYRRFLYSETKLLQSKHGDWDQDFADDGDAEAHEDREWVRLAHAYLLGKKLRDEEFCNVVVNGLVEKMAETDRYPTGLAADIYTRTTSGDKLRSLIVDLHIWKGLGTWLNPPHNDASGPADLLQDVWQGLAVAGDAVTDPAVPMPWEVDICEYHSHDVTAKCERAAQATFPNDKSSSDGELTADEEENVITVASPPRTPRRSPRNAAVTKAASKVHKPTTPKRR